jgi:hypothetical protein
MGKILAIAVLALAAAPAVALAQAGTETAPSDVKGWQAATWGMTEQQILDAFPGQVVRMEKPGPPNAARNDTRVTLHIPKYEINGVDYGVNFGFDKDGRLSLVALAADLKQGSELVFSGLSKLLTERYGAPTTDNHTLRKRDTIWRLKSTTIELGYLRIAGVAELVTLMYAPPSPEANKL